MDLGNEKFKAKFGLPQHGFSTPIDLEDIGLGFSTLKDRQEPEFKSLFHVYITQQNCVKPEALKPVTVTVAYGKATTDGIITGSTEFKRKLNWPIGINFDNEFFYNTQSEKFYYQGKEIDGIDILKKADQVHMTTTRFFAGLGLRTQMAFFNVFLAFIIKLFFYLVATIYQLISGIKASIYDFNLNKLLSRRAELDMSYKPETASSKPISIYGYDVKKEIAFSYSVLHLLVYAYLYKRNIKPAWVLEIFQDGFLTLMYALTSLGIINIILSGLFKLVSSVKVFLFILTSLQDLYIKSLARKPKL